MLSRRDPFSVRAGPAGGFTVGANLPWLDYGQDFGASAWRPRGGVAQPDRREAMRRGLDRLAEAGASLVRWWLLADGRSALREGTAGGVSLAEPFLDDVSAAVDALRETRLRALFVLTDFQWFRPRQRERGVGLFGRSRLVRDPSRRADLLGSVFAPIAERFGREPAIFAWDLMNEPEWSTFGVGTLDPLASISRGGMRAYLSELAALFHARAAQPLTVGLASVRGLPLLDGVDVDFHQVHWYERTDDAASLSRPVATRALGGRRLLLGEFPTRGASVSPAEILHRAAVAGYAGALAWSLLAGDPATDATACAAALASWPAPRGEARA
jgi:hypothetical protein